MKTHEQAVREILAYTFAGRTSNGKPIDIEKWVEPVLLATRSCQVCFKSSDHIGLFIPKAGHPLNPTNGKERLMFYGLCDPCSRQSDFADQVEGAIADDASMGLIQIRQG